MLVLNHTVRKGPREGSTLDGNQAFTADKTLTYL